MNSELYLVTLSEEQKEYFEKKIREWADDELMSRTTIRVARPTETGYDPLYIPYIQTEFRMIEGLEQVIWFLYWFKKRHLESRKKTVPECI